MSLFKKTNKLIPIVNAMLIVMCPSWYHHQIPGIVVCLIVIYVVDVLARLNNSSDNAMLVGFDVTPESDLPSKTNISLAADIPTVGFSIRYRIPRLEIAGFGLPITTSPTTIRANQPLTSAGHFDAALSALFSN